MYTFKVDSYKIKVDGTNDFNFLVLARNVWGFFVFWLYLGACGILVP